MLRVHDNPYLRTMPIYGLVDFDPHGIEILSTYKYGSVAQAHANHRLAVERITWLDLEPLRIPQHEWLRLSSHDRRKCRSLLRCSVVRKNPSWQRSLQWMLFANIKAEIQSISSCLGGLERYLNGRIQSGLAS